MSTPSLASFYDEAAHLGNLFAARGPYYGPLGHRGVDFNGHPVGTSIPSPVAGVVAFVGYFAKLGNGVIVDTGGEYLGFWHLAAASSLRVGQRVALGQSVGPLGSTGTASSGPHVHITREPGLSVGTARARDPLPLIRAAVAAAPQRKARSMSTLYFTKTPSGTLFALAGDSPGTPANWLETRDQGLANALAAQHGNAAELSAASFESWKARYSAPVSTKGGATAAPAPSADKIADAVADTLAERLAE